MKGSSKNNFPPVIVLLVFIVLVGLIALAFLSSNYVEILKEPLQTPEEWLSTYPHIQLGEVIISEPSSSVIVLILSLLTIGVGFIFLCRGRKALFQFYWGICMLFTGLGAALAGVSYQAFSYELKCRGYEYCLWTSWWEVSYMLCTVAGVGAAIIGIAYFIFNNRWQRFWSIYAVISTVIYTVIIVAGTILKNPFLISFELMVMILGIGLAMIFVQCLNHYFRYKERAVMKVLGIGGGIALVIAVYFAALVGNWGSLLWKQGIWFNENDVLHVMMIGWVLLVYKVLGKADEVVYEKQPGYSDETAHRNPH